MKGWYFVLHDEGCNVVSLERSQLLLHRFVLPFLSLSQLIIKWKVFLKICSWCGMMLGASKLDISMEEFLRGMLVKTKEN